MHSFPILIDFQNKRLEKSVFKGSETIGELTKSSHSETFSLSPSRRRMLSGFYPVHCCFCSTHHLSAIIIGSNYVHFLDLRTCLPCSLFLSLQKRKPGPARSVQLSRCLIKNLLWDTSSRGDADSGRCVPGFLRFLA